MLVTQIMKNSGETEDSLYKSLIFVKKKKICPIEVKSSGYKNHKSFDLFLQKYPIKIEDKFIIYTKDFQYADGIMYIPLYMTMCL